MSLIVSHADWTAAAGWDKVILKSLAANSIETTRKSGDRFTNIRQNDGVVGRQEHNLGGPLDYGRGYNVRFSETVVSL